MKLDIFTSSLVLVLPINVFFLVVLQPSLQRISWELVSLLLKISCQTKKVAGSLG
jgi:hypothetical protein